MGAPLTDEPADLTAGCRIELDAWAAALGVADQARFRAAAASADAAEARAALPDTSDPLTRAALERRVRTALAAAIAATNARAAADAARTAYDDCVRRHPDP